MAKEKCRDAAPAAMATEKNAEMAGSAKHRDGEESAGMALCCITAPKHRDGEAMRRDGKGLRVHAVQTGVIKCDHKALAC